MSSVPVTWTENESPLPPCAVAAMDLPAKRLARRMLQLDQATLGRLLGVAGKNTLVVLGVESDLPWVDGVVYLGRDSSAPGLLLPTLFTPTVPGPQLLERALRKRFSGAAVPLAILPQKQTKVIPCGQALRLDVREIEKWLGGGNS